VNFNCKLNCQTSNSLLLANMSSESNTQVVVAPVVDVVVVTEKKVKAPTLGAKYSRFMAFGHWFVSQQSTELVSEEVRKELYNKLMVFASLEEQTAFYEDFLTQVTATNKTIRKMVAASKKPAKVPKAPRAKKTKAALPQDGLVAQLIADANSSETEVSSEPVAVAEKKPKAPRAKKPKVDAAAEPSTTEAGEPVVVAEKKPKAPRAKKVKAAAEPVANTVVETSPELVAETVVETVAEAVVDTTPVAPTSEGKKTKKTEKAEKTEKHKKADSEKPKKTKKTKVEPAVATEEIVEDDIDTRMVTIADKDYLIDNNNNVYDMEPPHGKIGTFNAESGEVTLN